MRTELPMWAHELATSLNKDTQSIYNVNTGVSGDPATVCTPSDSSCCPLECGVTEKEVKCSRGETPLEPPMRMQHSSMLTKWLVQPENEARLAGSRVLVIGGGQTAAHLAQLALGHGSSVTLCSRRRITQKLFDVDVKFAGDKRPKMLKQFWNLQPRERVNFNCQMRGGGSMSFDAYTDLCNCDKSKLMLVEETELEQAQWYRPAGTEGEIHVRFDSGRLAQFDFVWLAIGGDFDLDLVPIYASLQTQHPIVCVNGLPCLREDLSWAENVPLYVMGAFAQLQLGADALNLSGARSGSVIVAKALLASQGQGQGQGVLGNTVSDVQINICAHKCIRCANNNSRKENRKNNVRGISPGVWNWKWSGGEFEVNFVEGGEFVCKSYPAHAHWFDKGPGKIHVDWVKHGRYDMEFGTGTGTGGAGETDININNIKDMKGHYTGYPEEWRTATFVREHTTEEKAEYGGLYLKHLKLHAGAGDPVDPVKTGDLLYEEYLQLLEKKIVKSFK